MPCTHMKALGGGPRFLPVCRSVTVEDKGIEDLVGKVGIGKEGRKPVKVGPQQKNFTQHPLWEEEGGVFGKRRVPKSVKGKRYKRKW